MSYLYKGSDLESSVSGFVNVPNEPNTGKPATVKLYRQMASHGYKTGFQHIEEVVLVMYVDGERIFFKKASGANVAKARACYAATSKDITPADNVVNGRVV